MISWKTLLMEAVENQGYTKGHQDGCASGRMRGREEGIAIAKKQIAKALLHEGLALILIARVTNMPVSVIEAMGETHQ